MEMKFRKKPVVIEAKQFTENTGITCSIWCGGRYEERVKPSDPTDIRREVLIPTLEGVMTASLGDWIIRGIKGEFYPCRNDIFTETYEPVGDDDAAR